MTRYQRLAQRCAACLVLFAVLLPLGFLQSAPAMAQTPVTGTADFRNAPQLVPGTFSDRLVTGDSAWYSLMYRNGTPFAFDVSIPGSAPSDVTATVSFVAPTLDTVAGPTPQISGDGLEYPLGNTNVWFLKVSLETTGQTGIEFPIEIGVTGVESTSLADCASIPGCTFDEELDNINRRIEAARAELGDVVSLEQASVVQLEIDNLNGFLDSAETLGPAARDRLARAEEQVAQLCAPEPTCEIVEDPTTGEERMVWPDPGTRTPLIGWVVGLGFLAFGVRRAIKKVASSDEDDDAKDPSVSRIEASLRKS